MYLDGFEVTGIIFSPVKDDREPYSFFGFIWEEFGCVVVRLEAYDVKDGFVI